MVLSLIISSLYLAITGMIQIMRMRKQLISLNKFLWTTNDDFTTTWRKNNSQDSFIYLQQNMDFCHNQLFSLKWIMPLRSLYAPQLSINLPFLDIGQRTLRKAKVEQCHKF